MPRKNEIIKKNSKKSIIFCDHATKPDYDIETHTKIMEILAQYTHQPISSFSETEYLEWLEEHHNIAKSIACAVNLYHTLNKNNLSRTGLSFTDLLEVTKKDCEELLEATQKIIDVNSQKRMPIGINIANPAEGFKVTKHGIKHRTVRGSLLKTIENYNKKISDHLESTQVKIDEYNNDKSKRDVALGEIHQSVESAWEKTTGKPIPKLKWCDYEDESYTYYLKSLSEAINLPTLNQGNIEKHKSNNPLEN